MNVSAMSSVEKLEAVLHKGCVLLPADVAKRILALLSPMSLAIMAGAVAVWAASHLVGVGEVADVVLLATGLLTIGGAAFEGCKKLVAFAIGTYRARTDADIDKAAHDFAEAVSILGVDVVLGLLMKGKPEGTFKTIYKPSERIPSFREYVQAMPRGGPTRMYEATILFTKRGADKRAIFAGEGGTDMRNVARIGRDWVPGSKSLEEAARAFRSTVYHERFHQRLTQGLSLLGRPALYMRMSGYKRSFILRYIEEAAAETYQHHAMGGRVQGEVAGFKFACSPKYQISLVRLGQEASGILLGPVTVAGSTYTAYFGWRYNNE